MNANKRKKNRYIHLKVFYTEVEIELTLLFENNVLTTLCMLVVQCCKMNTTFLSR
jgi:hypothetical protein